MKFKSLHFRSTGNTRYSTHKKQISNIILVGHVLLIFCITFRTITNAISVSLTLTHIHIHTHTHTLMESSASSEFAFVSSFLPPSLLDSSRAITNFPNVSTRKQVHGNEPTMSIVNDKKKSNIGQKLAAIAMTAMLALPFPQDVLAASSGGRIGGGSFRSAPRSAPTRTYRGGTGYSGGYRGYSGGGLFSPVVPVPVPVTPYYSPFTPFSTGILVGGGGGSLVSALVVAAGAGLLLRGVAFRNSDVYDDDEAVSGSRDVAVVTLKLGLLATATRVRDALDSLARGGDTTTAAGLSNVLADASVSLLRSSEYWVSASSSLKLARGGDAERLFNEASVLERSKLARETLSNVGGQRRSAPTIDTSGLNPEEYVVVTLVVATSGAIWKRIPRRGVNGTEDVRQVLSALGSVSADEMQALEVLWAPQQHGDSMSRAEMRIEHPELKDL